MSIITNLEIFKGTPITLYETATGKFWLPNQDRDIVIQTIIRDQVYDHYVVNLVKQESQPGDTILDLGSNFGQMSVLFSKHVGPTGKVYAFEAQEWVRQVLQLNLGLNDVSNCTVIDKAVWDESDCHLTFPKADFVKYESYGSYAVDPTATSGNPITTIKIDDLDIQGRVAVMKIDVQGSDLRAMVGARQTILKHKPVILFEYEEQFNAEFASSWQDYIDFIESIGYYIDSSSGPNHVVRPKP